MTFSNDKAIYIQMGFELITNKWMNYDIFKR